MDPRPELTPTPPIFIGGAPRSGTTLLRAIIDAHPSIACGPELRAIPSLCALRASIEATAGEGLRRDYSVGPGELDRAFAAAIASFLEPRRRASGKARIAEKTPANVLHFPALRRLFPAAPLIAIHRDPRDVVASLLSMDWRDGRSGERLEITRDPVAGARLWLLSVETALQMSGDAGFFLTSYEALVDEPDAVKASLFRFLGEPFDAQALRHDVSFDPASGEHEPSNTRVAGPIDRASVGRWRRELSRDARRAVEEIAGPFMTRLGYA
jgi:hypothetical protein